MDKDSHRGDEITFEDELQNGVIVAGETWVGKSTLLWLLVHKGLPPDWPEVELGSTGGKIKLQPIEGCAADIYDFQGIRSAEFIRPFLPEMRVIMLCRRYGEEEPEWFSAVDRLCALSGSRFGVKVIRVLTCCDDGKHGHVHFVPDWDAAASTEDLYFCSAKHNRGVDRIRNYLIREMPSNAMAGILPAGLVDNQPQAHQAHSAQGRRHVPEDVPVPRQLTRADGLTMGSVVERPSTTRTAEDVPDDLDDGADQMFSRPSRSPSPECYLPSRSPSPED